MRGPMSDARRDFLKQMAIAGALPAAVSLVSPFSLFANQAAAQVLNPDFDQESYEFWSGFLGKSSQPVVPSAGQTRGGAAEGSAPVFLHYDQNDGFKNAAQLD